MSESPCRREAEGDPFAEADEWLAAQVRQLFRAHHAGDTKAGEVTFFHFGNKLTLTLRRLLELRDPVWDGSQRWLDGLTAKPEYLSPGHLRLHGTLCWVSGEDWYYDPFDLDFELCPKTGVFQRYVIRFGDHRLLEEKKIGRDCSGLPVGGWTKLR